jgi:outer membrane murein-binding lipoprotein Lpp
MVDSVVGQKQSNICKKHNKQNIHILGCADCVNESGTTKIDHLAMAVTGLNRQSAARLGLDMPNATAHVRAVASNVQQIVGEGKQ